jgi:hypothetical protein
MAKYLAQATDLVYRPEINSTQWQIVDFMPFIFGIILIIGILLILMYVFGKRGKSQWRKTAEQKLAELDQMEKSDNIFQLKSVIMDADKLLDFVLKSKRVKGETLGERLRNAKDSLPWKDYQNLWEAHKLRNKMSHEMSFSPSAQELKEKYAYFRKGIKSL